MSISFNQVPNNIMVPGFYTEFDNSLAGGESVMPWNVLLVGAMSSGGTANENVPVRIFNNDQADTLFGKGSQCALMARAFRKANEFMPLYVAGIKEGSSGYAKASKTIAKSNFTGTATAAGEISFDIGGQSLSIPVSVGDDGEDVVDKVIAAINANDNLPVTAELDDDSSAYDIVVTAKNGGVQGNSIKVEFLFDEGATIPAGLGITTNKFTLAGGTGAPSLETLFNNIRSQWFNIIVSGFDDSTTLSAIKTEMESRFTATRQQSGICFYGYNGALGTGASEGIAAAANKNAYTLVCCGLVDSPTTPAEIAANAAGVASQSAEADAAMPITALRLNAVKAPKRENRLSLNEEQYVLECGAALISASDNGDVYVRRLVTTYLQNASGASDKSYQQAETLFTLFYIRWDWNNYMGNKYARSKLARDGFDYGPGQVVMTPKKGRAEALARFSIWQSKGLVQNYEDFKKNLVVAINDNDSNRLDFLLPATLINQLFVCASKVQFRK